MIQLPPFEADAADQQPVYDFAIVLSDIQYRFLLFYRERNDRWYMVIYDADDEVLISGKKLSVNRPLLHRHQIDGLFPGDIILFDTSGTEAECGFADLGTRCLLMYFEPADLELEPVDYGITIAAVP